MKTQQIHNIHKHSSIHSILLFIARRIVRRLLGFCLYNKFQIMFPFWTLTRFLHTNAWKLVMAAVNKHWARSSDFFLAGRNGFHIIFVTSDFTIWNRIFWHFGQFHIWVFNHFEKITIDSAWPWFPHSFYQHTFSFFEWLICIFLIRCKQTRKRSYDWRQILVKQIENVCKNRVFSVLFRVNSWDPSLLAPQIWFYPQKCLSHVKSTIL